MDNLRKSWLVCVGQIHGWAVNPRVYLSFLLGVVFVLMPTMRYLGYAKVIGQPINIFEPFIIIVNDRFANAFLFLGYLLLISDAPFMEHRSFYSVIRVNRRSWVSGMCFYIFSSALTYYVGMLVISMLAGVTTGFIANIWSDPLYTLAANAPGFALVDYNISFSNLQYIQLFTPALAIVQGLSLPILYATVIGLIIFLINVNNRRIFGGIVALIIHISGFTMLSAGFMLSAQHLSLLCNAMPINHNLDGLTKVYPSFGESYLIFIILIIILYGISMFLIRRCDFKSSAGDRG